MDSANLCVDFTSESSFSDEVVRALNAEITLDDDELARICGGYGSATADAMEAPPLEFYNAQDIETAISKLPVEHERGVPKTRRGPTRASAHQYWKTRMHPIVFELGVNAIKDKTAPLHGLEDAERVCAIIQKREVRIGGKKDAIVAILKIDDLARASSGKLGLSAAAITKYRSEMRAYVEVKRQERENLHKTPIRITWAELQLKATEVLTTKPDSLEAGMALLYLGDIPPTRYNYHDVGFFDYDIETIKIHFPKQNCYSMADTTLYIGKHKTVLDHGPLIIKINQGPLLDFINRRAVPGAMWLFPGHKIGCHYTRAHWSRVCNAVFGGIDAIRRAYITEFGRGMSMTERVELAKKMAHSVQAQMEYEYAATYEEADEEDD